MHVVAAPVAYGCSPCCIWLQVFALLMELEKVVVLFDEIEEFCLDRSVVVSRAVVTRAIVSIAV